MVQSDAAAPPLPTSLARFAIMTRARGAQPTSIMCGARAPSGALHALVDPSMPARVSSRGGGHGDDAGGHLRRGEAELHARALRRHRVLRLELQRLGIELLGGAKAA